MRSTPLRAAVPVLAAVLASCSAERASLDLSLQVPPTSSPLVFHGDCVAGFILGLDLMIRETRGVDVVLESLGVRAEDAGTAEVLAAETMDRAALRDRFGESADALPGHGRLSLSIGLRTAGPSRNPIVVGGEVRGHDAEGSLRVGFRLPAVPSVLGEGPPGGGACSPP